MRGWLTKSEGEIVGTSAIEILDSDEPENEESAYSQTEPSDDTIITDDGVGDDVTLGASDGIAAEPISGLGADGENEGAPESSGNESVSDNNSAIEAESADVSSNELGEMDVSSNEFDVSGNNLDVSGNEFDVSGNELDVSGNEISIEEQTEFVYKMVVSRYCYNRNNKDLLVTTTDDGKIIKYVYGNVLISSYTEETDSEGNKDLSFESYSYDLRGSVTRVTDEAGNIKTEYAYSTYGKRSVISGDQNHFSVLGYCARDGVLTEENGLLYMRARYYSTELMRFINQDIVVGDISNSNSLNRYTYVEGNPATLIDPFGLCAGKEKKREQQKEHYWNGGYTIAKGSLVTAFSCLCAEASGVLCLLGPGGIPFGVVGALGSLYELACGLYDISEGGQEIYYAYNEIDQVPYHPIKQKLFNGDADLYNSVELLVPHLLQASIGLGYEAAQRDLARISNEISRWGNYSNPEVIGDGVGNSLIISDITSADIVFGSSVKSAQKLANQMESRGWTEDLIKATVDSPYTIRDSINKATGNEATVFYTERGAYVIVDNITKAIVQISDNNDPSTWIPDQSIINPYKP